MERKVFTKYAKDRPIKPPVSKKNKTGRTNLCIAFAAYFSNQEIFFKAPKYLQQLPWKASSWFRSVAGLEHIERFLLIHLPRNRPKLCFSSISLRPRPPSGIADPIEIQLVGWVFNMVWNFNRETHASFSHTRPPSWWELSRGSYCRHWSVSRAARVFSTQSWSISSEESSILAPEIS